eukprot:g19592.t1
MTGVVTRNRSPALGETRCLRISWRLPYKRAPFWTMTRRNRAAQWLCRYRAALLVRADQPVAILVALALVCPARRLFLKQSGWRKLSQRKCTGSSARNCSRKPFLFGTRTRTFVLQAAAKRMSKDYQSEAAKKKEELERIAKKNYEEEKQRLQAEKEAEAAKAREAREAHEAEIHVHQEAWEQSPEEPVDMQRLREAEREALQRQQQLAAAEREACLLCIVSPVSCFACNPSPGLS